MRIEASRFLSDEPGAQGSLFPSAKPGVVVFIQFSHIEGDEFTEVVRLAQPSFVFDLRIAPRFDVGNLNRRTAFALFDEVKATYVDATTPLMMGEQRESAVQRFREAIAKIDLCRPLFFLFGSDKGSIISDSEVLNILASAGKPAADLVVLPT
ncbi:MAG: hypothetical protein ABI693_31940 [Bryobacteraceae bacterium]